MVINGIQVVVNGIYSNEALYVPVKKAQCKCTIANEESLKHDVAHDASRHIINHIGYFGAVSWNPKNEERNGCEVA